MIKHNARVQLKEDFNLPKGVGQFDTVPAGTKGTVEGRGFGALLYVKFDSGQEGSVWVDRLIELKEEHDAGNRAPGGIEAPLSFPQNHSFVPSTHHPLLCKHCGKGQRDQDHNGSLA